METQSRRRFIGLVAKALGVLSIVPGTFFKPKIGFGADIIVPDYPKAKGATKPTPAPTQVTPFQQTLEKATKTNLKQVVGGAPLTPEEKFAIAAVRELDRSQVETLLLKPGKGGPTTSQTEGGMCGDNCGSFCGNTCGSDCPQGKNGVIDRNGMLGIRIKGTNRGVFQANVRKALAMVSPSGPQPVPVPR